MLNIKIYGKPTPAYHFLKSEIENAMVHNSIDYTLIEKNDLNEFLKNNIQKIPTIEIQGKRRTLNGKEISDFVQETILWLLRKNDQNKSIKNKV